MLSRAQQILLKRAQVEAQLLDVEYRDAVETVSAIHGARSSTDSRLTDRHLDNLLSYLEAIYWGRVDAKALQSSGKPAAVFRQRGFWAAKNRRGDTSRDRFTQDKLIREIGAREAVLMELGCGLAYFQSIRNKLRNASGALDLVKYLSALDRTLRSKTASAARSDLDWNV